MTNNLIHDIVLASIPTVLIGIAWGIKYYKIDIVRNEKLTKMLKDYDDNRDLRLLRDNNIDILLAKHSKVETDIINLHEKDTQILSMMSDLRKDVYHRLEMHETKQDAKLEQLKLKLDSVSQQIQMMFEAIEEIKNTVKHKA